MIALKKILTCDKDSNTTCDEDSNTTCDKDSNTTFDEDLNTTCDEDLSTTCDEDSNTTCDEDSNTTCDEDSNTTSYLFTQSLMHGFIPTSFKSAAITPVFKSGIKTSPCNYRPISLTSTIIKVFELDC